MNKEFFDLTQQEQDLQNRLWEVQRQLGKLRDKCKHKAPPFDKDFLSVKCVNCGADMGWSCPKSPNNACEYNWEETGEDCIYCGQPEERK